MDETFPSQVAAGGEPEEKGHRESNPKCCSFACCHFCSFAKSRNVVWVTFMPKCFGFFFHWRQVLSAAQEQIITLWNMTSRCRGNALPPRHLRHSPPRHLNRKKVRSATLRQYALWLSILGKFSCWCCCFVVWHLLASQPAGQRSVWGGKSVTYILKIHNYLCQIHPMTSQTERYQWCRRPLRSL